MSGVTDGKVEERTDVEVLDGNDSTLSIVFQVVYDPSIVPQRGNHLSELRLLNIQ